MIDKAVKNIEVIRDEYNLQVDSIFWEQNGFKEVWFNSDEKLHELRSCSKVLVAMAVGIAIEKKMFTLDTLVYPFLENVVKIKNKNNLKKIKKWTIRDLLTHTTGYEKQMMSTKDIENIKKEELLEYALNYDMPYEVGEHFAYNNVEPFIIAVFFQEKFGINLKDFINENIFRKMDIKDFKWDDYGKYCPGATGLYLKHSDFHKIGKLLLNDGMFDNKKIISEYWINEMCRMQLETPMIYKKDRVLPKAGVGYYTFISRDGYVFKDGSAGQYLILNKERKLLISIMSSEKNMNLVTEILRDLV